MSELERRVDQQENFEERVAQVLYLKQKNRWRALGAWILLFTIAVGVNGYINHRQTIDRIHDNAQRIADNQRRSLENRVLLKRIQRFRLHSCRETYGSFLLVFRKFFPKERSQWSSQQIHSWAILVNTVDSLERFKCPAQTGVEFNRGEP